MVPGQKWSEGMIIPLTKTGTKPDRYFGRHRDYTVEISRESRRADWYIIVTHPSGGLNYDGYWRDSAGKPIREAIAEAFRGGRIPK